MSDLQENRTNRSLAERVPAFSAFRYPGFTYLWLSTLLWSAARWMERVVLWWYVYQLTESAFLLGVVTAVQWVPLLLLGPWMGVVADRFDRRRTIIFAQVLMLTVPLAMAYLILSGQIQLWHIIIVVLVSGTGVALDQPARQALLYDQVGREGAMNAQALYRLARHGPLIIGALIAGGLMQQIGPGPAFFAVAATYLVGLALTFLIPTPPKMSDITSAWKHLLEGLSYIKGNRILLALFGVEIAGDIFGLPFQMLLPVLARDVLGVGPMGYSVLFAASGVGELGAALAIASLGDFKAKRWLL
ncbi:MAG: MFS transporter, partial [Chloroflexota bacterium]|nr:MFS transporter [Chloroflexota bacterium]